MADDSGRIRRLAGWLGAHPRITTSVVILFLALGSLAGGLFVGVLNTECHTCPSIAQIYVWEPRQATKILDRDGELIAELFVRRRTPVPIEELPDYVPQAFIAVEDKRFYEHGALSWRGIARAAVQNVLAGEIVAGGSTITQQLARNMFARRVGFETSFERKLKEMKVAFMLEDVYSKRQILEAYINQINYGRGHYGIESASEHFFGISATELNPAQAALLAAVINAPSYYYPFDHPERARERRNLVLHLMAEQGYLSPAEADQWQQAPLPEHPHAGGGGRTAPYFVKWVREQLDDRYGSDLYTKGLRIHTTLDLDMQRRARAAMRAGWRRIEGMPGYSHPTRAEIRKQGGTPEGEQTKYLQGALIAMDPQTGAVRALIGGRDFEDSKFNRATQARRQPGSAFKPIVYTAAIASGIPASHIIYDSPIVLERPDGTRWAPENYGGNFRGPMTLRQALVHSVNVVAIKLAREVGLETVVRYAHRMGIGTPIPTVPSIAIGAASVIPMDVAQVYSTLATLGVRPEPHAVVRVEDSDGHVLWERTPTRERVIDRSAAYIVVDMMRDVVDHGTGYNVRNPEVGDVPYTIPVAGKTGTTNDATNVWFAGFTPNLVSVVWLGFDEPQRIMWGATGGGFAAPIWADFMRSLYVGGEALLPVPEPWKRPEDIVTRRVDQQSGALATRWCPTELVYTEIYLPGTVPAEACDLHGPDVFGDGPLGGPALEALPQRTPADSALPGRGVLGRDTAGAGIQRPM